MKEHQPTNSDLLNLGMSLIEKQEFNGIKCFIDYDNNRITVELERQEKSNLLLGARLPFLKGTNNEKAKRLEQEMAKEITVYFKILEVLKNAKPLTTFL